MTLTLIVGLAGVFTLGFGMGVLFLSIVTYYWY